MLVRPIRKEAGNEGSITSVLVGAGVTVEERVEDCVVEIDMDVEGERLKVDVPVEDADVLGEPEWDSVKVAVGVTVGAGVMVDEDERLNEAENVGEVEIEELRVKDGVAVGAGVIVVVVVGCVDENELDAVSAGVTVVLKDIVGLKVAEVDKDIEAVAVAMSSLCAPVGLKKLEKAATPVPGTAYMQ